jgi:actin-like ATPase involved in cell morphogenesis
MIRTNVLYYSAVRPALERKPPDLASDVVDRGIILTGGTSLLPNLDRLITQEIGISCYVADNPLECVAMGAGTALDHLDLIRRFMPAEGEWLVTFARRMDRSYNRHDGTESSQAR